VPVAFARCIINDRIRYVPSKARFVNVAVVGEIGLGRIKEVKSKQGGETHRSGGQQDMATDLQKQRKMESVYSSCSLNSKQRCE
jgi:hypothetical protein